MIIFLAVAILSRIVASVNHLLSSTIASLLLVLLGSTGCAEKNELKMLQAKAERGSPIAQNTLGFMYLKGQGVPQDYCEASKWLRMAAEQGHAQAQYHMGVLYGSGEGVPQDHAEEFKWYLKAADQGHPVALNNLGTLYEGGEGVPQDYTKAAEYYRKSAARGCDSGYVNLGNLYAKGQGVVKDHELAVSHFRKAAGHGEAGAQFNLALAYARGHGVDRDLIEAHKWAILAADQGFIDAGKLRDSVAPQLSPHEMDESYRRASETLRAIERRRKDSGRS
jgi:uncharacterized protein